MQLPNFLDDPALNDLRTQMGARELGTFRLSVNAYRFTVRELEQLILEGIEIRYLDEVRALPDGTLCYKDRRVLLYTREAAAGALTTGTTAAPLPPYHFSNCATVRRLREQPGFARHTVSAREDGYFQIGLTGGSQPQESLQRLRACEECLQELAFDTRPEDFTIARFFERFRRNLVIDNQEPAAATGRFPKL
jgi:hypothetical protein